MRKKEYLDEKKFQKTKAGLLKKARMVLLLGLLIGGGLIGFGIYNKITHKQDDSEKISVINNEIDEINYEIDEKNRELNVLKNQEEDSSFEILILEEEIRQLKRVLSQKKNSINDFSNSNFDHGSLFEKFFSTALIMFGGVIVLFSIIISLAIKLFANSREITAFQAQATLPVVQEGMEEMGPTVGKFARGAYDEFKRGSKNDQDEWFDNDKKEWF